MKEFKFKVALMEEHFNDNYIESSKYPKASFVGKLENFNMNTISETSKKFNLIGKISLRNKIKEIETVAYVKQVKDGIELKTKFNVSTDDFNIDIPAIISTKLNKKVAIDCNFLFK